MRPGGRSEGGAQRPQPRRRSSSGAGPPAGALPPPLQDEVLGHKERRQKETHSEGDSDSPLPSPLREPLLSSDLDASGEESDPRPPPGRTAVWIVKGQGKKVNECV